MYSDLDIRRPRLFLTNAIIPLLILFNVYMHFSMQGEIGWESMLIAHLVSSLLAIAMYAPVTFYWVFRLLGIGLLFWAVTTGKENVPGMLWSGFWGVMFLFTPKYSMRNDLAKASLFYKTNFFEVDSTLSPVEQRHRAGELLTRWIFENLPQDSFCLKRGFAYKNGWELELSQGDGTVKMVVNVDYIGEKRDELAFALAIGIEDVFLRNFLKNKDDANFQASSLLAKVKPVFTEAHFTPITHRDFAAAEAPIVIKRV